MFQVHAEQRKRGQFQDSIAGMKVWASTAYKEESIYLDSIFDDLTEPVIHVPDLKDYGPEDQRTNLDSWMM